MMKRIVMAIAVLAGLIAGGCSERTRAVMNTGYIPVVRYSDKPWEGGLLHQRRDVKLDEQTYAFTVVTNKSTSQAQTVKIALVHAADIALTNGYSHFRIDSSKMTLLCGGREGEASPNLEVQIRLLKPADVSSGRKIFDADHIMRTDGLEVDRPDGSADGRAKAFLANEHSCYSASPHEPSEVNFEN